MATERHLPPEAPRADGVSDESEGEAPTREPPVFARLEQVILANLYAAYTESGDLLGLNVTPPGLARRAARGVLEAFDVACRPSTGSTGDDTAVVTVATPRDRSWDVNGLPRAWAAEPPRYDRIYRMGRRMAASFTCGLLYDRTLSSLRAGLRAQRDYNVQFALDLGPDANSRWRGEAEWFARALELACIATDIEDASEAIYIMIRNT